MNTPAAPVVSMKVNTIFVLVFSFIGSTIEVGKRGQMPPFHFLPPLGLLTEGLPQPHIVQVFRFVLPISEAYPVAFESLQENS